jgi:GNAT superfamily N-acetyltransferase
LAHTDTVIRLGTPADLPAAAGVYRRASLSNAGDRDNLLAHPEYLVLGPEGLAEGRTYVAEEDGSVVGFATWAQAGGTIELEDLFVDPGWRRRGIAAALVSRIVDALRARGVRCLEVTANPHAQGFYSTAGFIDCGVAETDFGAAPRKRLAIRLGEALVGAPPRVMRCSARGPGGRPGRSGWSMRANLASAG